MVKKWGMKEESKETNATHFAVVDKFEVFVFRGSNEHCRVLCEPKVPGESVGKSVRNTVRAHQPTEKPTLFSLFYVV